MTYVPVVVPPTPPKPPSPRTRELAKLLAKVLDEYAKAHPQTTNAEIRAAIRMAQGATGPDRTTMVTAVSLGLGIMMLMLGAGIFFLRGGSGGGGLDAVMPVVIIALVVVLAVVAALVKVASR